MNIYSGTNIIYFSKCMKRERERVASRGGVDVPGCHVNSQKYKPCEYRLSNWQLSNKTFDILFKKFYMSVCEFLLQSFAFPFSL